MRLDGGLVIAVNKTKNPSLSDEIWHLKHISKKGKIFEQLSKDGILTVGDFLKEHETNPLSLEEVLREKALLE